MVKKIEAGSNEKGLTVYSLLSKATYLPTRFYSSNESIAKIDEKGNIIILKPGSVKIIAEYGTGKTGTKKKYRTLLKIKKQ